MKHLHTICKPGAAVRLHGYAPARVREIFREKWTGQVMAECVITGRSPGWRDKQIGPHGYRTGEIVVVHAGEAIPRDCLRVKCGRLWWPVFSIFEGATKDRP